VLAAYARPDNALSVPEVAKGDSFAKYVFSALGRGAIGFAPFGVDRRGWNILGSAIPAAHARNFGLLAPIAPEIARLNFEGRLKTAVEGGGVPHQKLDFGEWQATISFGFPQYDGRRPPGTKDVHGAALVAALGPDEFLVTGMDASAVFEPRRCRIRADEEIPGPRVRKDGAWVPSRPWNGDETDSS
jgi:hypothetical protein